MTLESKFEAFALTALRARKSKAPAQHPRIAHLTRDSPDGDRYSEAFRLLRNIGRGIAAQHNRDDAMRMWIVTKESVDALRADFLDLLTEPVVQLLNTKVLVAEREAVTISVVNLTNNCMYYASQVKLIRTKRNHLAKAITAVEQALEAGIGDHECLTKARNEVLADLAKLPAS